jgi:hypothetical protein
MRTFQDGMHVTFIGAGHTSLLGDVGTVRDEGETVSVAYKHFSICLDAADLILTKGQRVRLGNIAGTVLEPADIWHRAGRLSKNPSLLHTTPVHWDDDTATEEPTKNLRLSDIPVGTSASTDRTTAVNAVIDGWWAATEKTGVYEEDVEQLKRLISLIR